MLRYAVSVRAGVGGDAVRKGGERTTVSRSSVCMWSYRLALRHQRQRVLCEGPCSRRSALFFVCRVDLAFGMLREGVGENPSGLVSAALVGRGPRRWRRGSPSRRVRCGGKGARNQMRLATIRDGRREAAAVVSASGALPVSRINEACGAAFEIDLLGLLKAGQVEELRGLVSRLPEGSAEELWAGAVPREQVVYGPPYRHPRKIWGIGLNYVEHASDLKEVSPSQEPASFMKPDTTIVGPGETIRLPEQSRRTTGEAELGVIIGREAKDVSEEEAPSVVAGLTTVIDMTAEDILEKNPRFLTRAKSFDTFFSFGPQVVTLDEVEDVEALEVSTVINGELHRKNLVSNMTFSPWFLVSFHSKVMTLLPGDIISTGTPGAVVIRDGDRVSCEIEGFETLTNPVAGQEG